MSGEHFLSDAVLRQITSTRTVRVMGLPWTKEELTRAGINSLTANILCRSHNSQLSGLDALAARIFIAMREAYQIPEGNITVSASYRFNGYDLERWFLKVFFGLVASGNLVFSGHAHNGGIPEIWSSILLGKAKFPQGRGLYVQHVSEFGDVDLDSISISVMGSPSGEVVAASYNLAGVNFFLVLNDGVGGGPAARYRPNSLNMGCPPVAFRMALDWIGAPLNRSVDVTLFSRAETARRKLEGI